MHVAPKVFALGFALLTGTGSRLPHLAHASIANPAVVQDLTPAPQPAFASLLVNDEPASPSRTSEPAARGLDTAVTKWIGWGMMHLPRGFHLVNGTYDVVIHFHGAPHLVERALEQASLNAVLVVVNRGIGSGVYEDYFEEPAVLDRCLSGIQRSVAILTAADSVHLGRLALSAWSAGYGAISRIVGRESGAKLVDAVLLADGLHAGFDRANKQDVDARRIRPFADFANKAARGDKLMALSHSSIPTLEYASTTQTAQYLIRTLEVPMEQTESAGPGTMTRTLSAEKGGLRIDGYTGDNKRAHIDHLVNMGATLFPTLQKRWAR